jgi:hypothetical protein
MRARTYTTVQLPLIRIGFMYLVSRATCQNHPLYSYVQMTWPAHSPAGDCPKVRLQLRKGLIAHCPQWRETGRVDIANLDAHPRGQLAAWLHAARAADQPMPEAMTNASATSNAVPSARLVVLRSLRRGLVFFPTARATRVLT